ncbi:AMP-dependent synthetase/ligase [Streptomyces zhihengii]
MPPAPSAPSPVDRRPPSVAHLFLSRVEATPDAEAYRYPVPAPGGPGAPAPDVWHSLTWAQTARRVEAVAAGLLSLGIRPEQRVAIASETRVEWIIADLGVMCAGAATTTVYPGTDTDETAYILADSGSRVLFAESERQLAKAAAAVERLPGLTHVVLFEEPAERTPVEGLTVLTLGELERRGLAFLERRPGAVRESVAAVGRDGLATLIYTSGTTGRPKGVLLPHDCWAYQGVSQEVSGVLRADDVHYLWLPLSHAFGKALLAGQIRTGHVMAVDGRVDRVIDNLAVIRPTVMACVPRILEKVYNGVLGRARAEGGTAHRLFLRAADVARRHTALTEAARAGGGKRLPAALRLQHALADRLVYAKVRAAFGGRLRHAVSGSAALAPGVGPFFTGAGIPVLEAYGLTETSAGVAINPPGAPRSGTVGTALPGSEVRIAGDGEILLRGPGVMRGYHGLPEVTAEVLESDGWLRTGDIGELDPEGYLRITDRKKDMFKTSGGKYVAPSEIEGRFKAICPFVGTVVVIGDGRNYCTALITLDESALMPWAAEHGMRGVPYSGVVADPRTRALVDGFVEQLNGGLQRWQTLKRFTLLPRELGVAQGELTPSLKVRRPVVEQAWAEEIAAMYPGA